MNARKKKYIVVISSYHQNSLIYRSIQLSGIRFQTLGLNILWVELLGDITQHLRTDIQLGMGRCRQ